MDARTRAHRSWRTAERLRRLSDGLVKLGPINVGLDGVLTFIPGAGGLYSAGAGAVLIWEAVGAGVSGATLARMLAYLALDTVTSEIPIVGDAIDFLFPGHLLAARALQRDVERRHGPAPAPEPMLSGGELAGR
jgi:hypothetical protein